MQKGFHKLRTGIALATAAFAVAGLVALGGPAAAGVVCTGTPAGLIGRWPADNSTVDVAHGRDGTLVGDTAYAAGKIGQAFSFDGSGDTVTVPDDPDWTFGGSDFTVAAWVKFAGLPGVDPVTIMAHDPGAGFNPKWILWWRPGFGLEYFVNDPTEIDVVNAPSWAPTVGQWYHVAVTRSGTTFTLYVDGAVVATATKSFAIPDSDGPLTVGSAEQNFFFNGSIDEPEIYQRALDGTEIAAIHTAGTVARCTIGTSSVTLQAAPTTATPGSTISLTGTLTLSSGSVTGMSIQLVRSVDGAAETSIGTVFAAADGSFSLDDSPPAGEITYRAEYAGATNMAAASGWASASLQKKQSTVTIDVSDRGVTFGQAIKVKAHLHGGDTNRVVRIYAQPSGGHKQLLKKGTVGNDGVLVVSTKPARNTAYSATYTGDAGWKGDSSGSVSVTVRVRWSGKAAGGYATSNGFRLYHYSSTCRSGTSTACPAATFTLAPNHAGQKVTFLGRYCKGGKCISDPGTYRLNKKSQVTVHIFYSSPEVIGFSLYLRFKFAGDSDHEGATSKVIKEKITA
jgi:hypothetical protein